MIISTVRAFEEMRTQFAFFRFKVRRVCLWVSFATPAELIMVFRLVRPIILDIFGPLDSLQKHEMIPFSAIFTLRNPRVHVSTSNSYNELTDIESLVNKSFGFTATLDIPYIDPNNHHV